ncbi:hypothetical protein BDK51DRAFT_2258, partial [Blyttiomyces helicus]
FQTHWARGEIIVVEGLADRLHGELWTPDWFMQHFGSDSADIIDCRVGAEVLNVTVGQFFQGFTSVDMRPIDSETKAPLILKLKDWPADQDFESKFPAHFDDFMNALPFKPYFHRSGELNLSARLAPSYLPPDLGPKMYNAYGSGDGEGGVGTTNLHLDMADAVNIMAFASDPLLSSDPSAPNSTAFSAPPPAAAVWDLYPYEHLATLRRFLTTVAEERGIGIDDPVHDQRFYLDKALRERLYRETGVRGWRVLQNPGDAVFLPAGTAHQVCNYRDAIKIAIDFVSPETVDKCEGLTNEFRLLSNGHRRRVDLLQLKTILWHAVRDC